MANHIGNDPKKTATAFHEAGHAVMAILLGRPIEKVTILPAKLNVGGARLGACKIQKGRTKPTKDAIEDEVLILLSGMVAESHYTNEYSQIGAAQDLMMVRRQLMNRAQGEKKIERLTSRLLHKTEHLLSEDTNRRAIKLIAQELLERDTISGRTVKHLRDQAADQSQSEK